MKEKEIEEELQMKINKKINVKYIKLKIYTIKIDTKTIFYEWKEKEAFSDNIHKIIKIYKLIERGII